MKIITIDPISGFESWRLSARECLIANISPGEVSWNFGDTIQDELFGHDCTSFTTPLVPYKVPAIFLDLAKTAACHTDPNKYNLLYNVLWRLSFENRHILKIATDDDMIKLSAMVKAVRKDAYKITAFLRFRQIDYEGSPHYVAWYQPEYYSLERVLPFFRTRFRNMQWSILTPYLAAHWDGEAMKLGKNPDPALYPKHDQYEQYWLTYYASIFNPARTKKSAMLNQMPKKYWKNMPETALIPDMLQSAEKRARDMIEHSRRK